MTSVLKMDIMHGPLSYLDREVEITIPGNTEFLESYVNFNASPPYKMYWDGLLKLAIEEPKELSDATILEKTTNFVHSQLESAKKNLYKEIKRVIDLGRYSSIYFFHPADLVSTPKKFSKLEAEAKEKNIKLVSVYHTLKDFNFRTQDEVKELCMREYMRPTQNMRPTQRKVDIAMFRYTHERYRLMIEKYEKLKEVS